MTDNANTTADRSGRLTSAALWCLVVLGALALPAASLVLGELNQDEGWYIHAAKLVSRGQRPYVDFASTQPPVMPYVYTLSLPFVNSLGLAGGRLFTAILGVLCGVGAAWLAARLSPRRYQIPAMLVTLALVALNTYQAYFFTVVKTYALSGLFLIAGFHLLLTSWNRRSAMSAALAGVCLVLSAGTRISLAAAAGGVFLTLAFYSIRRRNPSNPRLPFIMLAAFTAGALVTAAVLFVPFAIRAPESTWFGLVEYHCARSAGGYLKALAWKAGFLCRMTQAYLPAAVALIALVCFARSRRNRPPEDTDPAHPVEPVIWTVVFLVTLVHFSAPFPYDDYQTPLYPLAAAGIAVALIRTASRFAGTTDMVRRVVAVTVLSCAAAAAASPLNQSWLIGNRHLIWWPLKEKPAIVQLREASRAITRELAKPGDVIFTQDTYVAVDAGMEVPHGMELGPFCYFPDWDRRRAEACHVLNREMLRELIAGTTAPVAAMSGYGFAIRSPDVVPLAEKERQELRDLLQRRYEVVRRFGDFGQASTELEVLQRKKQEQQ